MVFCVLEPSIDQVENENDASLISIEGGLASKSGESLAVNKLHSARIEQT